MKITVLEGNRVKLDGGAMFGHAPKQIWQTWITPDSQNRVELATRTLLIETKREKILFDTGAGAFFEPALRERFGVEAGGHRLLNGLKDLKIDPSEIDHVILSHLHFDHAGGVLTSFEEGPLKLLFPNATYYLTKTHFERALKPHIRERASFIPVLQPLLQESCRLKLLEEGEDLPIDAPLRWWSSSGHTIGLLILQLDLEGKPLYLPTDLIPGLAWVHLPITMGYDRYSELVVQEKEALLKELCEKDGILFLTHEPKSPFAKVTQDDKGRFSGKGCF